MEGWHPHLVGRFNLLVQGRNLRRGLHRLSGAESFSQIVLMNRSPLNDKPTGSRWKLPLDERQGVDINDRLSPSVKRMEMRRLVITEIHLDYDTVKSRKLRHGLAACVGLERLLLGSSRSASCTARQDTGQDPQAIRDDPLLQGPPARIHQASTMRKTLHAPHMKTNPPRHTLRCRIGGIACSRLSDKSR